MVNQAGGLALVNQVGGMILVNQAEVPAHLGQAATTCTVLAPVITASFTFCCHRLVVNIRLAGEDLQCLPPVTLQLSVQRHQTMR